MKKGHTSTWNIITIRDRPYIVDVERGQLFNNGLKAKPFLNAVPKDFYVSNYPKNNKDSLVNKIDLSTLKDWQQKVNHASQNVSLFLILGSAVPTVHIT